MKSQKAPHRVTRPQAQIVPGDLVYLYANRNKLKGRERYIVVSVDSNWCTLCKFSGVQFHKPTYKVKTQECYKIPSDFNFISSLHTSHRQLSDSENSDIDDTDKMTSAVLLSSSPALHPPPSVPAEISEPPQDTQSFITASDEPVIQEDLVDIPSSASVPTSPSTTKSCQPAIALLRSSNRQCKLPATSRTMTCLLEQLASPGEERAHAMIWLLLTLLPYCMAAILDFSLLLTLLPCCMAAILDSVDSFCNLCIIGRVLKATCSLGYIGAIPSFTSLAPV